MVFYLKEHPVDSGISRRKFVVGAASLAAIGAVAACGGGSKGVEAGTSLIGLSDIPEGESKLVTTENGAEVIVSRISATEAKAFSAICTHQGCTVIARSESTTRLNSSHVAISYAVFCLQKKKHNRTTT